MGPSLEAREGLAARQETDRPPTGRDRTRTFFRIDKVVNDEHVVAPLDQLDHGVGADVAGAASHKNGHGVSAEQGAKWRTEMCQEGSTG